MSREVFIGVIVINLVLSLEIIVIIYKRPIEKRPGNELLCDILSPEQQNQLLHLGYIDFPSPSYLERVYRVQWPPGYVQVRENGKLTMWLCLRPAVSVPDADIMVMHKLMIEADEETYLQKANRFSAVRASSPGWAPW
jgi:hypothetical protein